MAAKRDKKPQVTLLIPDCHRPYHDEYAWALTLEIAAYYGVSRIVIGGDFADFYSINGHGAKDPRLLALLKEEIKSVNDGLNELDTAFPGIPKTYIEGNHEFRLERFLISNASALLGLVTCEGLFNIEHRKNWEYIPYGPHQKYNVPNTNLWGRHTPLASSANATLRKAMCNFFYFHTHRLDEKKVVGFTRDFESFGSGWLGDSKYDVFNYVKGHDDWQQAFTLLWTYDDEPYYRITPEIVDRKCNIAGKVFKA